jgi:hypothetical protein
LAPTNPIFYDPNQSHFTVIFFLARLLKYAFILAGGASLNLQWPFQIEQAGASAPIPPGSRGTVPKKK